MTTNECIELFEKLHPNFFEKDYIKSIPENEVYEEMILLLNEFSGGTYKKQHDESISFGFFEGDINVLKTAVAKVDKNWTQYFNKKDRVYCGFVDGEIACFCLVENFGVVEIGDRKLKIGGPGCVGTVPHHRNKGIGLTMVKNVTEILKEEGYDISYIHYTGVWDWYKKLGYETLVRWDRIGILVD